MNLASEKWSWAECGTDNAVVYVDDGCTVGGVYHGSDTDLLSHERARLIAAAPAMLETLKDVQAALCSDFPDDLATCQRIIEQAKQLIRNNPIV